MARPKSMIKNIERKGESIEVTVRVGYMNSYTERYPNLSRYWHQRLNINN